MPESAFSPGPNMVFDRGKMKWVPIEEVPFWKIILSTAGPFAFAAIIVGLSFLVK